MNLLVEEKGKHFDPTCVDAWMSLCERKPSVYLYPSTTINDDTTGDLISTTLGVFLSNLNFSYTLAHMLGCIFYETSQSFYNC